MWMIARGQGAGLVGGDSSLTLRVCMCLALPCLALVCPLRLAVWEMRCSAYNVVSRVCCGGKERLKGKESRVSGQVRGARKKKERERRVGTGNTRRTWVNKLVRRGEREWTNAHGEIRGARKK